MFDMHVHSRNSHDSTQTLEEICSAALKKGIPGFAVCDHVDLCYCHSPSDYENIKTCLQDVSQARQAFGREITILQGLELGEYRFHPEAAKAISSSGLFDVILGSVHTLYIDRVQDSYSQIDFGSLQEEELHSFFREYLRLMLEMAETYDMDVLCHLTCPLRYINGKYHRNFSIAPYREQITAILETILARNIALEVNTSGIFTPFNDFMPDRDILKLYKDLGGSLITIGSDAHVPQRVGVGLAEASSLLREIGFTHEVYYEKRQPKFLSL